MSGPVRIERRFRGPANSANGGYSCGLLARQVEGPAEVTLRAPPPLERELEVDALEDGALLRDGEAVIAEARAIDGVELPLPEAIGVEQAFRARAGSPMHRNHPFPECFVCGPAREAGDGMLLTCGTARAGVVAAPWEVDSTLPTTAGGAVAEEVVWAALDCPSGLAWLLDPEVGVAVLGRMAARLDRPIEAGTTCVAVGWPIEREGRKLHSGSALFSAEGEPLARARATWIELPG